MIILTSNTPNLKEYQMQELYSDSWGPVKDTLEITLEDEKHEILFRTVNLANIAGPEHKVLIMSE